METRSFAEPVSLVPKVVPQTGVGPSIIMPAKPVIDVVDDDPSVLRALARLIRSHGFLVRTFASGMEFMDSLTSARPDCVILYVQMP